uniref:Peptidase S1 domain-containing protein n=1 Tax=Castor canadensis TaxID=51338 RepID=A0A8C0ZPI6_CASCN
MQLLLLLLAFFLPPMAKAGEIIRGHKAKPHSHPYMAYLQRLDNGHWLNLTLSIFSHQLERKVKLTPAVQLLRLPRVTSQVKPGTVCSVAGWGWMTPTGKPSDKLREVQLKVMEDQVCKTSFTNYNSTYAMCAGDPKIRRASFHGDSGGPLVCHNVAQGIVSYGPIDGTAPQVFTKVSHFLQWIENTMNHR